MLFYSVFTSILPIRLYICLACSYTRRLHFAHYVYPNRIYLWPVRMSCAFVLYMCFLISGFNPNTFWKFLLQKRSTDGGKQGASIKKLKKDKLVGVTGKNVRSETSMVSMAPRVKPELPLPVMYFPSPILFFNLFFCFFFFLIHMQVGMPFFPCTSWYYYFFPNELFLVYSFSFCRWPYLIGLHISFAVCCKEWCFIFEVKCVLSFFFSAYRIFKSKYCPKLQ